MYKIWTQQTPSYLFEMFRPSMSQYGVSNKLLTVPLPRIDLYKSSLSFQGASMWNTLPMHIKAAPSLSCFKKRLYKYLISQDS